MLAACCLLLPATQARAGETAETIQIRAALSKDLAGRRRANLDLMMDAYDDDRFVVYDGGGGATATAWSPVYADRDSFGRDLLPRLQSSRFDIERAVLLISVWKDKAFVTTIDSGFVVDRQSGARADYRDRSLWTFAKKDDEWLATGLIQALGEPAAVVPARGIADPAVAQMLEREAEAWTAGDAGAVTGLVDEDFVAVEAKFSSNPAKWLIIFGDRDEYAAWLEERLARVDYTLKRQVVHVAVGAGGDEAVAVTHDRIRAAPVAGTAVYDQERFTYWLLRRQGGDWVATWVFWKAKEIPPSPDGDTTALR